jgi:hypothetical protein
VIDDGPHIRRRVIFEPDVLFMLELLEFFLFVGEQG